jgi:hypothetical protein
MNRFVLKDVYIFTLLLHRSIILAKTSGLIAFSAVIQRRLRTSHICIVAFPNIKLEIMMNETTLFRRKLTHCFGAN